MKAAVLLGGAIFSLGLTGCGNSKAKKEPEQLDPYRALMADRINEVIYSKRSPEKMLRELALLNVQPDKLFPDFKEESKIDDWFAEEWKPGLKRYTSLTCGLSPVVDEEGHMKFLFRNRKFVGGKTYPELPITPVTE